MKVISHSALAGESGGDVNRGYTLTEMIIAMVLVSALMSTVWGVMSLYNGLLTAGRDRTNSQQLVRSLFDLLNEDLSAVNADAEPPLLSEFGDAFDDLTSNDEFAYSAAVPHDQKSQSALGQLSMSGSASAMRLQVRTIVPPAPSPPSDIDLLNELGGGSVSRQQGSRRVSEFQTIVYQIISRGQRRSVNAGGESLAPGLYRIQIDSQSMAKLEADHSTAGQLRQLNTVEISRSDLTVLLNPQTDSETNSLSEQRFSNRPIAQLQVDAVPEVVECQLEYFDGMNWQSSWADNLSRRLPVAVRVSLDVVEGKDITRLAELYPSHGTTVSEESTASLRHPSGSNELYSVSAKRYSRTILLDSTAAVGLGGSQ